MDGAPAAAPGKWLCVPRAVGQVDVDRRLAALGPEGGNPDQVDRGSHIWMTEEAKFARRTVLQPVHFPKVVLRPSVCF